MGVRAGCWLLALTALVSACSSEEPPGALPPVPSVDESSSPRSNSPAALPSAAALETSQGAAAFATHFLTVVGDAYERADPDLVRRLSDPGCEGCNVLIAGIQSLRADGQVRVGGGYEVVSAVTPALTSKDTVVDVVYRRRAGQVVTADGGIVATAPAVLETEAQVRVLWEGQGWRVLGYRTFAL